MSKLLSLSLAALISASFANLAIAEEPAAAAAEPDAVTSEAAPRPGSPEWVKLRKAEMDAKHEQRRKEVDERNKKWKEEGDARRAEMDKEREAEGFGANDDAHKPMTREEMQVQAEAHRKASEERMNKMREEMDAERAKHMQE